MGKILYTEQTEKGSINYISGVVTAIKESTDDKHPHVITMQATLRDTVNKVNIRRTLQLRSWPNNSWSHIEAVHKMKVGVGSFITAVTGNITSYTGKNSKEEVLQTPLFGCNYSCDLSTRTDPNIHIVSGSVKSITEESSGSAVVGIAISVFDRETQKRGTKDYSILLSAKKYASLKKAGIKKGGNLSVVGTPISETTVKADKAEYADRSSN